MQNSYFDDAEDFDLVDLMDTRLQARRIREARTDALPEGIGDYDEEPSTKDPLADKWWKED